MKPPLRRKRPARVVEKFRVRASGLGFRAVQAGNLKALQRDLVQKGQFRVWGLGMSFWGLGSLRSCF